MIKRLVKAGALVLLLALFFLGAGRLGTVGGGIYTLTQYAEVNGAQGMCYVLTDDKDHLVFIDGGWDANAELLLNRIIEHGSHVDAWIITHSHQDHVSAFNNLSSGDFDFTIGTIYCPDLDREHYRRVADDYDGGFEHYAAFRENLKKWEETGKGKVQFVHTGEEYDLIGLRMKIMSAYEKGDPMYEQDPENTGSVMFKLFGKEKSLLFCADVTKKTANELKKRWKKELRSDILQLGHHGVGWCPTSKFNLYVKPEIAFFDAPGGLIAGNEDAMKRYQDLCDFGAEVYTLDTAPNTVTFH